uniref:Uncharacterized protein n=1 Tax=Sipha flava TaxID=143950 RepID=A0A2S2R9T4_9HEMI
MTVKLARCLPKCTIVLLTNSLVYLRLYCDCRTFHSYGSFQKSSFFQNPISLWTWKHHTISLFHFFAKVPETFLLKRILLLISVNKIMPINSVFAHNNQRVTSYTAKSKKYCT